VLADLSAAVWLLSDSIDTDHAGKGVFAVSDELAPPVEKDYHRATRLDKSAG
jgi:hypothetical protein